MAIITGIEHIGVCAKDTTALKDWYVANLDSEVVYDNGKGTYFVKLADGSMIEIYGANIGGMQAKESNLTQGVRHLAIACEPADFDAAVKRFTDLGCPVVTPAAVNDKGVGTFFFRDPEGNILHLISRKAPLA